MDENNNQAVQTFRLNTPPQAKINVPLSVKSGDLVSLDGRDSTDSDGNIAAYVWRTGDGNVEKKGPLATHMYQIPGDYTIELTVRDNDLCETKTSVVLSVYENRPDLTVTTLPGLPRPGGGGYGKHCCHHWQSGLRHGQYGLFGGILY